MPPEHGNLLVDGDDSRHSSTRAALIYQHSSSERQHALADTPGALVAAKLKSKNNSSRPSGTEVARNAAK